MLNKRETIQSLIAEEVVVAKEDFGTYTSKREAYFDLNEGMDFVINDLCKVREYIEMIRSNIKSNDEVCGLCMSLRQQCISTCIELISVAAISDRMTIMEHEEYADEELFDINVEAAFRKLQQIIEGMGK